MTGRLAVALLPLLLLATTAAGPRVLPALVAAPNAEGVAITLGAGGAAMSEHPFFRGLGGSGRSCATCHVPTDGWSLVPSSVQRRFETTDGLDPLFRPARAAPPPHPLPPPAPALARRPPPARGPVPAWSEGEGEPALDSVIQ